MCFWSAVFSSWCSYLKSASVCCCSGQTTSQEDRKSNWVCCCIGRQRSGWAYCPNGSLIIRQAFSAWTKTTPGCCSPPSLQTETETEEEDTVWSSGAEGAQKRDKEKHKGEGGSEGKGEREARDRKTETDFLTVKVTNFKTAKINLPHIYRYYNLTGCHKYYDVRFYNCWYFFYNYKKYS